MRKISKHLLHVISGSGRTGTQVERGDVPVTAGNVDAGGEFVVVNSETCDFLHSSIPRGE